MTPRTISDERAQELRALYEQGKTIREIVDMTGITRTVVTTSLLRAGTIMRDPNSQRPKANAARIEELRAEGREWQEIAKELKVSIATAQRYVGYKPSLAPDSLTDEEGEWVKVSALKSRVGVTTEAIYQAIKLKRLKTKYKPVRVLWNDAERLWIKGEMPPPGGAPKTARTVEVECQNPECKKPFTISQWNLDHGSGKYCSRICHFAARKMRVTPAVVVQSNTATEITCATCGRTFYRPSDWIRREEEFCSIKCYKTYQKEPVSPSSLHYCGTKLKEMRTLRGMTQQQLADVLGIAKVDMVREWERGKVPSGEIMLRILLALRAKPEQIMESA